MKRPTTILPILLIQIVCAVFFLGDLLNSLFGFTTRSFSWTFYEIIELGAALGLLIGVFVGARLMMIGWQRKEVAESKLASLSRAFADVVSQHFDHWGLTVAERDVALFLIKGMSTAEIAGLRATSEGTVKAQSNAIYRKADVASRSQLVGLLIDDLMQDDLFAAVRDAPPPARETSVALNG